MTDTLLMLSGGIDSAYCMYKHLRSGLPLRVHHVHLKNHEGRMLQEKKAVERILGWMDAQGLTAYTYTESTFDYGSLPFIVKDHNIWALMIGIILADPRNKSITKVIRPVHYDSWVDGVDSPPGRRSEKAYAEISRIVSGRQVQFTYPMRHLYKADVIREMPPDLLDLCWWCRRPQRGRPCHKCYTCKLVDAAKDM